MVRVKDSLRDCTNQGLSFTALLLLLRPHRFVLSAHCRHTRCAMAGAAQSTAADGMPWPKCKTEPWLQQMGSRLLRPWLFVGFAGLRAECSKIGARNLSSLRGWFSDVQMFKCIYPFVSDMSIVEDPLFHIALLACLP